MYLENIQVSIRAIYIIRWSGVESYSLSPTMTRTLANIGAQTPCFCIFREREVIYELGMMHDFAHIKGGEG